ncbi:MAG: hypothetical protein ISS35_01555 [Kiritimatiellae bacterium]|nr:hypothetical protein [Kiritimatiellia bacterium]
MKSMLALLIIAGLCVGCGNTESAKPEITEQKSENTSTNWEPEMAKEATATCPAGEHDHDSHEGHDH